MESRGRYWRAFRREPWWWQVGVWMFTGGLAVQTVLGVWILATL